ncbi:MAG: DotU family type IV/VI secretion system protein [Stenotrophomonas nitritireducens]|uniref:DotU family type IV/VI secretion system protein n=1 Tax=Stenotrophomonas nitritireducens TaxID=83617 RepID=UPI001ACBA869|nr:DotU family type IV/VI secretion system protein [Stenotrophomonas nitritireducens]MBN8769815.1 DotU family type IV/VI secretion system protein [Stenotrophomonas sp.]MBN8790720.1 DotU family type IV/VI secretion system protein [Stenotrophomonas nitritireducens]
MARLVHHFAPLFSFGLALEEKIAANAADEQPQAVIEHARDLLERARGSASAGGKRPEQIEEASFAVVAWFDEIMARNPAWLTAHITPLQITLFNTNNAGNEFFTHLSNLKAEQDEVREVFYQTLLLGFVGQYYYENGDSGELGRLKELHARQLPVPPAPIHTLREERITPQPYASQAPAAPRYPRQWDGLLLKAGLVVALLIPLLYLAYLLVAAPRVEGPTVQELVDRQIAGFPCSDLSATVAGDGRTRVTGHVSRAEDLAALKERVATVKGVRDAGFDVQLRIWPHCEVTRIVKPLYARNHDLKSGLSVTPSTGHTARFTDGENVTARLVQGNADGYLYVDYFTVNGQVAHMYPNAREGDRGLVPAGTPFDVGGAVAWEVSAPYGQELILVISSPTPLYPPEQAPTEMIEPARDYLPRLEQMLKAHGDARAMSADYMFMQTEPAP